MSKRKVVLFLLFFFGAPSYVLAYFDPGDVCFVGTSFGDAQYNTTYIHAGTNGNAEGTVYISIGGQTLYRVPYPSDNYWVIYTSYSRPGAYFLDAGSGGSPVSAGWQVDTNGTAPGGTIASTDCPSSGGGGSSSYSPATSTIGIWTTITTCDPIGSSTVCSATSTQQGPILTQDAGNLSVGLAILIFIQGLIAFGLIYNSAKSYGPRSF